MSEERINKALKILIIKDEMTQYDAMLYRFKLRIEVQKYLKNDTRIKEIEKQMEEQVAALAILEKELDKVEVEGEEDARQDDKPTD